MLAPTPSAVLQIPQELMTDTSLGYGNKILTKSKLSLFPDIDPGLYLDHVTGGHGFVSSKQVSEGREVSSITFVYQLLVY